MTVRGSRREDRPWPAASLPDSYLISRRLVTAGTVAIIAGSLVLFLNEGAAGVWRWGFDIFITVRDWRP